MTKPDAEQAAEEQTPRPAGLLRRIAAAFYDALLLLAILFLAAALVMPLTAGEAVQPGNPLFTTYLFLVSFVFYAWFWTHGGQTLGMRAWRLRVQRRDGSPLTWSHALLRFMVGIPTWLLAGAGMLWMLVDKDRMSWHDRYSMTVVVFLPKPPRG